MARQMMSALAGVHKLDWESAVPGLGPAIPFDEDVTRRAATFIGDPPTRRNGERLPR